MTTLLDNREVVISQAQACDHMVLFVPVQVNVRTAPSTAAQWRDWSCAIWMPTNRDAVAHVHRMQTPPSGQHYMFSDAWTKVRWTAEQTRRHHLWADPSRAAHMLTVKLQSDTFTSWKVTQWSLKQLEPGEGFSFWFGPNLLWLSCKYYFYRFHKQWHMKKVAQTIVNLIMVFIVEHCSQT